MPVSVRVQLGAALDEQRDAVPDYASLRRLVARAARAVLRHEQIAAAELSVTLLDDAEITRMNRQFLSHKGATDVISFPLYGDGEDPVGDIYLGFEQAQRQAATNAVSLNEEIARLTVHGVLHVLGYDHPADADRVDSEMWQLQEHILTRLRIA